MRDDTALFLSRRSRLVALSLIGLGSVLVHCGRGEPPTWDGGASASIAPLPASLASLPRARTGAATSPAGAPSSARAPETAPPRPTVSAPSAPASHDAAVAAIDGGDPGKLPQTEDKPDPASPAFDARIRALWDAIVKDDPERAMASYFPPSAYDQVKDIPNPPADYRARLIAQYKRDIHHFHKWLGASADTAKLLRVDVPMRNARWMPLHSELNKISYWRVFGTRLYFSDEGKERFIEVSTMISWRGEWYVVHVRPVK